MIWGLARKANLDREMVYELVRDLAGKEHLHDMAEFQVRRLIKRLRALTGESCVEPDYHKTVMRADKTGTIVEYASPAQQFAIRALARRLKLTEAELWGRIWTKFGLHRMGHDLSDLRTTFARNLILSMKARVEGVALEAEMAKRQGKIEFESSKVQEFKSDEAVPNAEEDRKE
jgi:hypothetical protein